MVGIEAILVSPNFLFRIEKDRRAEADAYYLNDFELASRLSYFLWSSAARRGAVARRRARHAAASRGARSADAAHAAGPEIARLVETFGGQWLQFRGLESHQPDFYLYPAFDNYLRMSMVQETQLFFENLIREDRSILEFLDADYTFVNEYLGPVLRTARREGPEFRKVSLASTPRRESWGRRAC